MTAPQKTERPTKPYGIYKLRFHKNGQICKKHKGQLYYLGPWDDPEAAEVKFERILRQLKAEVEVVDTDGITLGEMATLFYEFKGREVERGALTEPQLREYRRLCQLTVDAVGRNVFVEDMVPLHFSRIRSALDREGYAPTTLSKKIIQIRAIFQWAMRNDCTGGKILPFGDELRVPTRREIRLYKKTKRAEFGSKTFDRHEIVQLLDAADGKLAACIWLGFICGFGHSDLAHLRPHHIDFENGWVRLPRNKTGVSRRAKLIPECVDAVRKIASGDEIFAMNEADMESDLIGRRFRDLQKKVGCWQEGSGRNHYGLRHTCRTVLDSLVDPAVCDAIMGHANESTASNYVDRIDDFRFEKAAEHLKSWLLGS